MKRALLREALGVLLVLHGLANAVMPMRAVQTAVPQVWAPLVVAAYDLAILGFVAAGLGVLRANGFRRIAIPAVWIGGLAALATHALKADTDLWVGFALSSTMPVLTTLFVLFDAKPLEIRGGFAAWRHRTAVALAFSLFAWVAASTLSRPWTRDWGTTAEDWAMVLPGDHAPRTPQFEILHAVTIDASQAAVWSWLAQLGQDRAGFYSYDWLERAFGADIHNVNEIRPEWQTRRPGDRVFATQQGYLGNLFGERPGWQVTAADPNHLLVLDNWGTFALVPQPDGQTRLLVRSTFSHARIPAWAAALNLTAFELPHFIMQRKMLLGIKARAEQTTT